MMYSGTIDNNYTATGWGGGTFSAGYTGYSSDSYQPNQNVQISTQTSQTQPRPVQQNNYFPVDTIRYGQSTGTAYGFTTQAAVQQSQLQVYSTNNDISKEGKYRNRTGRPTDYLQSETELERFSRYHDQTEEDYYRKSLGSGISNVPRSYSTSLDKKHPSKTILKKQRQKVKEKRYDHPRSIGTGLLHQPHGREDSFNQSRELNKSEHKNPTGMTNQHPWYSAAPYRETSESFPPKAGVQHRFGQKLSKKKKKKNINKSISSAPVFQPARNRNNQPASNRMEENDTESVYMKHELEIRDQQLKVAGDLLTKQGEMLKRMESNMNRQIVEGMVPHKAPPIPLLSPREERNSGQVTDDHWYQSGMPFIKRSRLSNMNSNETHPPIENFKDTTPYLTKGAKRKLAKRKINSGDAGGSLISTQQGLKLKKNSNEEKNMSILDRPEDSEGTLYVTSTGNVREPRFHPPLLGSSQDSIARKYGQYCQQCGLEFFSDFSKHVSNPLHKKRKARIISGCKPCNVIEYKDYEEYLSHNSMPSHLKIMKILQANRDSKYPFQGVKVTCPPFDHAVTHGIDVIKEITSDYCEACDKLIPSKKKSLHLHSKSHYDNWVLHLRIQKFKSLVKRERELRKSGMKEATTSEDETNKAVIRKLNIDGKKNKKTGKSKIQISSKKPKTEGKIDTNEKVSESQPSTIKLGNGSPTAETTLKKTNDSNPKIEKTKDSTTSEETKTTSEIKKTSDQSEDSSAHEDSVIFLDESLLDLTDTNKKNEVIILDDSANEDVLQEKSNDNCPGQEETQMNTVTDDNMTLQTNEIKETSKEESRMSEENPTCEKDDNTVAAHISEAEPEASIEETSVKEDSDGKENTEKAEKIKEVEKQTPTAKRQTRQSPRVKN